MTSAYHKLLSQIGENPQQHAALTRDAHTVVIAGPGTGKTQTLVAKAAMLLYEEIFPPQGLACLTYTHAMVEEIRDRLISFGIASRSSVFVGTLHSFCLCEILLPFGKMFGYSLPNPLRIPSEEQQFQTYERVYNEVWKRTRKELAREELQALDSIRPRSDDRRVQLPIDLQHYRRLVLNDVDNPLFSRAKQTVLDEYERALYKQGMIDFDTLARWAMKLVEREPYVRKTLSDRYPWLLIDEYQDLGLALHRIALALANKTETKLFVIGDPNQCIFGFAGAKPDYLREYYEYDEQFGEPIILQQSYRSYEHVVTASTRLVPSELIHRASDNKGFAAYVSKNHDFQKLPRIIQRLQQGHGIQAEDIMVLSRNRANCDIIPKVLASAEPAVPYFHSSSESYDVRKPLVRWIHDIINLTLDLDLPRAFCATAHIDRFWGDLLLLNGFAEYQARGLYHRMRLYDAVRACQPLNESAEIWLLALSEALDLSQLLERYLYRHNEDEVEYTKFRIGLTSPSQLSGVSLSTLRTRSERSGRVYVGTIHSSKGQECEAVIVVDADQIASNALISEDQRRLLYVGMTRARRIICLTGYNEQPALISKLVQDLQPNLQ